MVYGSVVAGLENAAGMDYLLGEAQDLGKGLGTAAIRAFVAFVFERYLEIDAVLADPEQANIPSWRALESAGFERIWTGLLPSFSGTSYLYCRRR